MCSLTIFLVFLYICSVKCEQNPENAISCQLNNAKDENDCRKGWASGMDCKDKSKCSLQDYRTEIHTNPYNGQAIYTRGCSDDQAAARIGMTCASYPYFNGGYPMKADGLDWDDEWEQYDCTTVNTDSNGNQYCHEWSSYEGSNDEWEEGVYTCTATAMTVNNITYCSAWSSVQKETKKCRDGCGSVPNTNKPTFCTCTCCPDDDPCYSCDYTPESEYEYSDAVCQVVNDQGACLEWYQEEYDQFNQHFREYESYECTSVSSNQKYCVTHEGSIDSEEEFEISSCRCADTDSGQDFCSSWFCRETGNAYWFPNYLWFLLTFFINVGGVLLSLAQVPVLSALCLLLSICLLPAVVYLGGIFTMTVSLCIAYLQATIAYALCLSDLFRHDQKGPRNTSIVVMCFVGICLVSAPASNSFEFVIFSIVLGGVYCLLVACHLISLIN